jgi:hypothetical protein
VPQLLRLLRSEECEVLVVGITSVSSSDTFSIRTYVR